MAFVKIEEEAIARVNSLILNREIRNEFALDGLKYAI